jgi:hypothetical protein
MDFGGALLPSPGGWTGALMSFRKIMLAGALCGGLGMPAPASAYIICNHQGDCWHSDRRESAPGQSFEYHPDDWYFHQEWGTHRRFRAYHEGRGYWHNGVWVQL